MSDPTSDWEIERDAATQHALGVLGADRRWNGYSIADLAPDTRAWTRIALARRGATASHAACLFYQHPAFNSLIPDGDPAGVAAILGDAAATGGLPTATYVLARAAHLPPLAEHYRLCEQQAMTRMAVDRHTFTPPTAATAGLRRLDTAALGALQALYASYPANAFTADQLAHGVFYGVRAGGRLVAAAGTHVAAPEFGIAAIGNVFTLPEARGRGYAAAVTAAVTGELLGGPCTEVILNVAAANETATNVYQRLGFTAHCGYSEARAILRLRA